MLDKHGVDWEDALDAAESTDRHYRSYGDGSDGRRYIIPGKTIFGQRIWVVFSDEGGGLGRVITAYEPVGRRHVARHKELRGD